ncbi:HAD family hydrolase [Neorhodopirellula lusitana]|uniref:HAD family hydrolase n=1 Tax=Neorhodopirellula lusitana TaxID=445327 RepID=UPI00384BC6B1
MSPLAPVIQNRQPLEPIPTSATAQLKTLPDVQAVIIDIYGTLVISGSGEVGTADCADNDNHAIRQRIQEVNSARLSESNPRPEVELLDIWQHVLVQSNRLDVANDPHAVATMMAELEARNNPTWPMPGAKDALDEVARSGRKLGIVSNAQAYTVPIVEDLIGGPLETVFELDLCHFSNRYLASKPGTLMFDRLVASLARIGLRPNQAVYVGNDMLNDVFAANQAGLQTALFAADSRSLRLREDHAACENLLPDVVLTAWNQLVQCFE